MNRQPWIRWTVALLACAALRSQVSLQKAPVVYLGCPAVSTLPATLVEADVRRATPEWQLIERQQVDKTSARGRQLLSRMNRRIREAVRAVAVAAGRDLVIRARDLADPRGRDVADLTAEVIAALAD